MTSPRACITMAWTPSWLVYIFAPILQTFGGCIHVRMAGTSSDYVGSKRILTDFDEPDSDDGRWAKRRALPAGTIGPSSTGLLSLPTVQAKMLYQLTARAMKVKLGWAKNIDHAAPPFPQLSRVLEHLFKTTLL